MPELADHLERFAPLAWSETRRAGDGNRNRMTSLEGSVRLLCKVPGEPSLSKGFTGSRAEVSVSSVENLVEDLGCVKTVAAGGDGC